MSIATYLPYPNDKSCNKYSDCVSEVCEVWDFHGGQYYGLVDTYQHFEESLGACLPNYMVWCCISEAQFEIISYCAIPTNCTGTLFNAIQELKIFVCLYMGSCICAYICVYVAVYMLMRNVIWLITVISSWFLLIFIQQLLAEWAAGSSHVCTTVFTRMQDNPNWRWAPKSKTSAKKHYFIINFIHSVYKACQIISTFTSQCHCLHLHSQCLHLSHTHS
jgi:hypothetical protein